MAITTTTHSVTSGGSTRSVTVTGDGAITPVQEGGPSGAWAFKDSTGARATVKINGQAATQVFAPSGRSKTFVDAIVTARGAG